MSIAIVAIIKIIANPNGLVKSIFVSVGETANPVIEGFVIKIFRRSTAETMFNMNNDVFIYLGI